MMQLVSGVREFGASDDGRVSGRGGIGVDNRDRIRLVGWPGQSCHIGELLGRARNRIARGPIEGGIVIMTVAVMRNLIVRRHGRSPLISYIIPIGQLKFRRARCSRSDRAASTPA